MGVFINHIDITTECCIVTQPRRGGVLITTKTSNPAPVCMGNLHNIFILSPSCCSGCVGLVVAGALLTEVGEEDEEGWRRREASQVCALGFIGAEVVGDLARSFARIFQKLFWKCPSHDHC